MACKHSALAAIYAKQMAEMDEPWKLWEHSYDNLEWRICDEPPRWVEERHYRQIPKTILINGIEVPEPMREKPEIGTSYWAVSAGNEDSVAEYEWRDDTCDKRFLDNGACHLSRENCIIHAKALFSFTEVK